MTRADPTPATPGRRSATRRGGAGAGPLALLPAAAPRPPAVEGARAAEVVHFLPTRAVAPQRRPAGDVPRLCARLRHLEGAHSPDEATMDTIAAAEVTALKALAAAESASTADVVRKLVALARRADAADGFLSETDLRLLRSAVRDLCRLDPAAAVA